MAIKVATRAEIDFGTFGAAATVTHVRLRPAATAQQAARGFVIALTTPAAVGANAEFSLPSGDIQVVYPSGDLPDSHVQAAVGPLWSGVSWQIDAMTSATTPVSVSGYSQQTYSGWTVTTEPD